MTISTAPALLAPISSEPSAEVHRSWDEERDGGVRAFRGILVASGLALAFWGLLGAAAWGLFQLPG